MRFIKVGNDDRYNLNLLVRCREVAAAVEQVDYGAFDDADEDPATSSEPDQDRTRFELFFQGLEKPVTLSHQQSVVLRPVLEAITTLDLGAS